ncbi:hypothetical protein [Paenibacillus macquariensis]|uniref:hypothetical protein n=1 Tax=Paenibacillus macquariensis TaxID=948756 RepID=UPI00111584BD|nr:hypothetical protein [Paenibacillus macquariensis]MEC0093801.1 hypothetical protein [Paenibacillus macquariensis]
MQIISSNVRSSAGDEIVLKKRKRSPLPSDFNRHAVYNQEIGGQQRSEGQSVIVAASYTNACGLFQWSPSLRLE